MSMADSRPAAPRRRRPTLQRASGVAAVADAAVAAAADAVLLLVVLLPGLDGLHGRLQLLAHGRRFKIVPDWNARQLPRFFTNDTYLRTFGKTLVMAALVTVACLVLALPFTYFLVRYISRRWQRIVLLARHRAVLDQLPAAGLRLAGHPGRAAASSTRCSWAWASSTSRRACSSTTTTRVFIVLVYVYFPFAALAIYASSSVRLRPAASGPGPGRAARPGVRAHPAAAHPARASSPPASSCSSPSWASS